MIARSGTYRIPAKLKGTILDKIVHAKLQELAGTKAKLPASAIADALDRAPDVRPFKRALLRKTPALIAEIKKASPSAGLIRKDFDPVSIGKAYQSAGAAAVSVVTESTYFRGNLEILSVLRWAIDLPLLRKDFIIDEYQILEARRAGADAVLLIAALLNRNSLEALRATAERYGMDALVEVHDEEELETALSAGASLVGVNNRDLRTFEVTLGTSLRIGARIPNHVTAVSESGIRSSEDVKALDAAGFKAVLVGEHLMRSDSPGAAVSSLLNRRAGR